MEMGQDGSSKVKFDRFFFGQDRTFFVAKHLGIPRSHPLGSPLRLAPSSPIAGLIKHLFFFLIAILIFCECKH